MNPTREALDKLTENGWCQGSMKDEAGRMCLLGAFGWSFFEGEARESSFHQILRLATIIKEMYPDRYDNRESTLVIDWCPPETRLASGVITRFNDNPATTIDDVVAVLEKLEVRLDETI